MLRSNEIWRREGPTAKGTKDHEGFSSLNFLLFMVQLLVQL